jgi:hypothetical protein
VLRPISRTMTAAEANRIREPLPPPCGPSPNVRLASSLSSEAATESILPARSRDALEPVFGSWIDRTANLHHLGTSADKAALDLLNRRGHGVYGEGGRVGMTPWMLGADERAPSGRRFSVGGAKTFESPDFLFASCAGSSPLLAWPVLVLVAPFPGSHSGRVRRHGPEQA